MPAPKTSTPKGVMGPCCQGATVHGFRADRFSSSDAGLRPDAIRGGGPATIEIYVDSACHYVKMEGLSGSYPLLQHSAPSPYQLGAVLFSVREHPLVPNRTRNRQTPIRYRQIPFVRCSDQGGPVLWGDSISITPPADNRHVNPAIGRHNMDGRP